MAGQKNKKAPLPESEADLQKLLAQVKKQLDKKKKTDHQALLDTESRAMLRDEADFISAEDGKLDADPDADLDEDDGVRAKPQDLSDDEEIQVASKTRKQKIIADEEEDKDDSPSSPTAAIRHPGPQFVSGNDEILTSKLPPRHPLKRSCTAPSSTSTLASLLPSSNVTTPPRTSHNNSIPFTPWKPGSSSNRPAINQHTPASASLLHTANKVFCVVLATTELAFADEDEMVREIKAAWKQACHDGKDERHLKWFCKDKAYETHVLHIVHQQISQLRGDIVKTTRSLVIGHADLGLSLNMEPDDLKAGVVFLLGKGRFGFKDIENRQGPFGNDLITEIIGRCFFTRQLCEGTGSYAPSFNPVPLALFRLVLTAIECVLQDWQTGTNNIQANKFKHDKYEAVYQHHLSSLGKYEKACPRACKKLQENAWAQSWKFSGLAIPHDSHWDGYLELGDFIPENEAE